MVLTAVYLVSQLRDKDDFYESPKINAQTTAFQEISLQVQNDTFSTLPHPLVTSHNYILHSP